MGRSPQPPRISGPASRRSLAISKASSSFAWTCKSKECQNMSKRSEDGQKKLGVILNTCHLYIYIYIHISYIQIEFSWVFRGFAVLIQIHFWGKLQGAPLCGAPQIHPNALGSGPPRSLPHAALALSSRNLETQHNESMKVWCTTGTSLKQVGPVPTANKPVKQCGFSHNVKV